MESKSKANIDSTTEVRIYNPNENDVLLGRGGTINGAKGNVQFRQLIKEHLDDYKSRSNGQHKSIVAKSIVSLVEEHGGRFLRKVSTGQRSFYWVPVKNKETVLDKVKQAFRDSTASNAKDKNRHADEDKQSSKMASNVLANGPRQPRSEKRSEARTPCTRIEQMIGATNQDSLVVQQHAVQVGLTTTGIRRVLQQNRIQQGNFQHGNSILGSIHAQDLAVLQNLNIDTSINFFHVLPQGNIIDNNGMNKSNGLPPQGNGVVQGSLAVAPSHFSRPQYTTIVSANAFYSVGDVNNDPRRMLLSQKISSPSSKAAIWSDAAALLLRHPNLNFAIQSDMVNQTQPNFVQNPPLRWSIGSNIGQSHPSFNLVSTNNHVSNSHSINNRILLARLIMSQGKLSSGQSSAF